MLDVLAALRALSLSSLITVPPLMFLHFWEFVAPMQFISTSASDRSSLVCPGMPQQSQALLDSSSDESAVERSRRESDALLAQARAQIEAAERQRVEEEAAGIIAAREAAAALQRTRQLAEEREQHARFEEVEREREREHQARLEQAEKEREREQHAQRERAQKEHEEQARRTSPDKGAVATPDKVIPSATTPSQPQIPSPKASPVAAEPVDPPAARQRAQTEVQVSSGAAITCVRSIISLQRGSVCT